jgi:hypothetical protein
MTATFNKFNQFTQDVATKKHDLSADVIKAMLTNSAPVATNAVKTDLTDITAANGYTAGGNACSITSCVQTSGVLKLILANPATWTASGSPMATFRYAALYNDTQTSPVKPLIGWYDYGSAVTLAVGEQFQIAFDATNGVFTIT